MFKVLKEPPYSFFLVTEVHTLARRLLTIISRLLPDDSYLKRQITAILVAITELENALRSSKNSEFTEILANKDLRRDLVFRSVIAFLDGVRGMKIREEDSRMAGLLLGIIEKQGRNIDRISYARESAGLRLIIEGFSQPEALQAIEKLGLQDVVQELTTSQEDFETTYHDRVASEAQAYFPAAHSACASIFYRLNAMLTYIDNEACDAPETHKEISNELNEVISEFTAKARARRTLNGNSNAPSQQPAPADENNPQA